MPDLFNEEGPAVDEPQSSAKKPRSTPARAAADSPARPPAAPAQTDRQPQVRFEEAFSRLETLVAEMERGELELEEMLARFEEGVALVRRCNAFLKQAQARVEQYVEHKDGHWVLRDLE